MKTTGIMAASSMLLASIASTASAQPGSAGVNRQYVQGVQDFCRTIVGSDAFPLLNWGECMSFNVVSESGFRTAFCKALREEAEGETLESYGFTDFADCIVNLGF